MRFDFFNHRTRLTAAVVTVLLAAAVSGLGACASVGTTIVAPQSEYLAYRRARTSLTVEDRLRGSWDYLAAFPTGRWAGELRPWFDRAEAKYYAHRSETAADLIAYLAVLPNGPHADEAKRQLSMHRARAAEAHRDQLDLDARFTEQRLGALARQRETTREAFSLWLSSLLSIRTWGQRTSALDDEFLFAWRIDKPQARCVEERCSKLVTLDYEVPGGGVLAKRELLIDVVLELSNGMLQEGRLEGPGMLSRLYEASTGKPVAPEDKYARWQATEYATEVVVGAAEARLPEARCAAKAAPPVVLLRACDGWTLTVRAAETPAEDDVVSVRGPKGG